MPDSGTLADKTNSRLESTHIEQVSRGEMRFMGGDGSVRVLSTQDDQIDQELLRLVGCGDSQALERLYARYHRRLLQFLWRLRSQREPLEEAINDTFWIVWQKAREFRGSSRVSTWIMGIAWRCAMKALRQYGPAQHESAATTTRITEPMVEPLAAEEEDDWLASGLARLPFEQRATLELAYFVGHSCEEIAAIMDCPVNTVKARMFQARIKLRNLLPKLGGVPLAASQEGESA